MRIGVVATLALISIGALLRCAEGNAKPAECLNEKVALALRLKGAKRFKAIQLYDHIRETLGGKKFDSITGAVPEGRIQASNPAYEYIFPDSQPNLSRLNEVFGSELQMLRKKLGVSPGAGVRAYLVQSPELSLQYVAVAFEGGGDLGSASTPYYFLQAHTHQRMVLKSGVIDGRTARTKLGAQLALVHHPAGFMEIDERGVARILDARRLTDKSAVREGLTFQKNRLIDESKDQLSETPESMNCYVPKRLGKTFANLNFVGPCNMKCTFCIGETGKDNVMMKGMDTRMIKAGDLPNIHSFLKKMKDESVPWIMLTGLNTEPLMFGDLKALVELIHSYGLKVALRSNALLAPQKMPIINQMDKATYSMHTLNPETSQKLLGIRRIPDWEKVLADTKVPVKINIVVCPENKDEIPSMLDQLSRWGVKRVSLRNPFGYWGVPRETFGEPIGWYANNPIHRYKGMEITLWETSETTVDSYNYVAGNGEILDEYGIFDVIKGIGDPANAKKLNIYGGAKSTEPQKSDSHPLQIIRKPK